MGCGNRLPSHDPSAHCHQWLKILCQEEAVLLKLNFASRKCHLGDYFLLKILIDKHYNQILWLRFPRVVRGSVLVCEK